MNAQARCMKAWCSSGRRSQRMRQATELVQQANVPLDDPAQFARGPSRAGGAGGDESLTRGHSSRRYLLCHSRGRAQASRALRGRRALPRIGPTTAVSVRPDSERQGPKTCVCGLGHGVWRARLRRDARRCCVHRSDMLGIR